MLFLIDDFFYESFYCVPLDVVCFDDFSASYYCYLSRILLNVLAFLVECTVFTPPAKVCVNVAVCLLLEAARDFTFFSVLALERMSLLAALLCFAAVELAS